MTYFYWFLHKYTFRYFDYLEIINAIFRWIRIFKQNQTHFWDFFLLFAIQQCTKLKLRLLEIIFYWTADNDVFKRKLLFFYFLL